MKWRIGVIFVGEKSRKFRIPKFIKVIFNIITWAFLICLVVVAGLLLYFMTIRSIAASKGEEYNPKLSMFTIISPSMDPTIKVYDSVIDVRVDDIKTIKKNDIITFESTASLSEGKTITHRVIDIIDDNGIIKLKTQGDNNPTADTAFVTQENIIGKVIFRLPQIGRIQALILNGNSWLFVILIPALLFILIDFKKLFKLNDVKEKIDKTNPLDTKIDNNILKDKLLEKEDYTYNEKRYMKSLEEKDLFLQDDTSFELEVGVNKQEQTHDLPKEENEKTNNNRPKKKKQNKNMPGKQNNTYKNNNKSQNNHHYRHKNRYYGNRNKHK